jgi:3-oxoacyl-[acyl-carrier-protein] synthase-3
MKMRGRELFKAALAMMSQSASCVMEKLNLGVEDLDLVVPHQANQRIIDALANRLGIPAEKVFSNIQFIGNTGSASIPIALDECAREGRVQPGDLVLTTAFGGGITWGSALLRW